MKFVRWLGAFGSGSSLTEAAAWELSQVERQVAAEPLWHGKSLIDHAKIGLVVDHKSSRFARGWLWDAYTDDRNGILYAQRSRDKEYKNMDKFLGAWSRFVPKHHGEAAFDTPIYSAVVVKKSATVRGKRRARRLANMLELPLEVLK